MKCEYCNGKGYINVLKNSSNYFFEGDEPIVEDECCEECGGSGRVMEEKNEI